MAQGTVKADPAVLAALLDRSNLRLALETVQLNLRKIMEFSDDPQINRLAWEALKECHVPSVAETVGKKKPGTSRSAVIRSGKLPNPRQREIDVTRYNQEPARRA